MNMMKYWSISDLIFINHVRKRTQIQPVNITLFTFLLITVCYGFRLYYKQSVRFSPLTASIKEAPTPISKHLFVLV